MGKPWKIVLVIDADPKFTSRLGKKVRQVGGEYTDARGQTERQVTLPISRATLGLIDAIAMTMGKVGEWRSHRGRLSADFLANHLSVVVTPPFGRFVLANNYRYPQLEVSKAGSPFKSAMRAFGAEVRRAHDAGLLTTPRPCEPKTLYAMLRVRSSPAMVALMPNAATALPGGSIWHVAVKVLDASVSGEAVLVERNLGYDALAVPGVERFERGWVERDDLLDGQGRVLSRETVSVYAAEMAEYRRRLADLECREKVRAARRQACEVSKS